MQPEQKQINLQELSDADLWKLAHEQLTQLQIFQTNHNVIMAELQRREQQKEQEPKGKK